MDILYPAISRRRRKFRCLRVNMLWCLYVWLLQWLRATDGYAFGSNDRTRSATFLSETAAAAFSTPQRKAGIVSGLRQVVLGEFFLSYKFTALKRCSKCVVWRSMPMPLWVRLVSNTESERLSE